MSFEDALGRVVNVVVRRIGREGAFVVEAAEISRAAAPQLLLPGNELPDDCAEGTALEVFVSLDSEDRPIATLQRPRIELGEVAFLAVTDLSQFGAFVDWGLPKELLVPFKEQTRDLAVDEFHPIGLYIDKTGRLAGTMRVSEMLRGKGEWTHDEWVDGEVWREDPALGVFVIVERAYVGLLPASEPHDVQRGDPVRCRIANILPDGKIELSLRGHAHEEVENDASTILDFVSREGAARVGDRSSPEQIRALFGLSKKAFKRATGKLLKEGKVQLDEGGFVTPKRAK